MIFSMSGIDINHSDCGRVLNTVASKCARFYVAEHSSTLAKILLVAGAIGAIVAAATPFGLGGLAVTIAVINSPHLLVTIGSICAIAYFVLKMMKYEMSWSLDFSEECETQKQEKEVVDILGGKAAFEALPRLSTAKTVFNDIYQNGTGGSPGFIPDPSGSKSPIRLIPIWSDYEVEDYNKILAGLAPSHVGSNPITVDVDYLERPFISVCVREKNRQNKTDAFVSTLFLEHAYCWGRAGHAGHVFKDYHGGGKGPSAVRKAETVFKENMEILRQLQEGTHSTHELV